MNWFYYTENGEKQGPVSGAIIKALAKSGLITRHTKIENENGRVAFAGQVRGIVFPEASSPQGLRKDEIVLQPPHSGEVYGVVEAPPSSFAAESDTAVPRATGAQPIPPHTKTETAPAVPPTPEEPSSTATNLAPAESSTLRTEENRPDEAESENAPTGPNPFTLSMSEEAPPPAEPNPFTAPSGANPFAAAESQATEFATSQPPLRTQKRTPTPNRADISKSKIEQVAEKVKTISERIAAIPQKKKKKILLNVGNSVAVLVIGLFIVSVLFHAAASLFSGGSGDRVSDYDKRFAARKIVDFARFNESLIVSGRLAEADVIHFRKEIYWPALFLLRPADSNGDRGRYDEGEYSKALTLGFEIFNYETLLEIIEAEKGLEELSRLSGKPTNHVPVRTKFEILLREAEEETSY